ncbi:rod shape-determining protein MreC [Clostridium sulfidigenes]|uniref:Cell shape-determining protein MreC n=1 Tax=Clostridium sulfidigenes TaxID=318464 RepID=A0A084JI34_9CLOT|nr:rod shape-determining protein MreC [Clostridium sulfidigenes]KEZ88618.1 rod shape-determining protein MreC [Clostridium sulfidigenes]
MKIFKNKLAVIVILLSVSFLGLIGYSVQKDNMSMVENGVGSAINSVQGVVYKIGSKIKSSFSLVLNIGNIKSENDELKSQNEKLKFNAIQNDILRKENDRLRGMLNFADANGQYNYIGVDILGLVGNNFLDGYVINKGEKDGIEKGMIALEGEGLVGQVTSVGSNWSIVQSICNENMAVAGYVLSTEESNGIVKGYKGNEDKFLTEITGLSLDSKIKEGDTILTSGRGGIYPKGIKIGEVLEIYEDRAKVVKSAIVKPAVDFNKVEQLVIIVPKEKRDVKN